MSRFNPVPAFAHRHTLLALSSLLFSPMASAIERDQHDEPAALAPTVITAIAPSSPLTVVTDPKDPRQPVPASDGGDYLKTIPGFSVIRSGGTNGDPVLRGMFGSRLNILTNGGVMLGACPSRMDAPTSYIAPQTYDRLTVIKGPQSVLWGPGGSVGTVLFERDPEHFDSLGTRLDASALIGSNGRVDKLIDAAAGSALGYARVIGNQSRASDYDDGHGDPVASKWDKWNSDVALGWTPATDTLLEITTGQGNGEARYAGRGMDGAQFKRQNLGLRFEQSNLGGILDKLEAQVYYNYADHVMDNYSLRTPSSTSKMAGAMASNVDRRTLGSRVKATWQWADTQLITGLDAQTNSHRRRSAMGEDAYKALPRDKDAQFDQYGAFAELTWHASSRDRLVSGARLDRASAKDYRQTTGSGMASVANPTAHDTRASTLPSGFVRYERDLVGQPATAYIGLGHAERFPDYWELFSSSLTPTGTLNAFDSVKPEKTTQLDVGIQYKTETLEAWASGYAGKVDDYILFNYQGTASSTRNVEADILGAELGAAYRLTERWKVDGTLAYAWGENRSDHRALAQMPPLETRLALTYSQADWSAGALWRVVSSQQRIDRHAGNVVGQDFAASAGFAVFSLNGAYQVSRHLKLSAGVDNLLDKAYAEHLNRAGNSDFGYPSSDPRSVNEPGRTLWTKVDVSF
jgi:iron complex outermembrane receptor protein